MSEKLMSPDLESKDFKLTPRKASLKRPGSLDDTSALLREAVSDTLTKDLPSPLNDSLVRKKNYFHRRSRSYDASTPDLTSFKLYSSSSSSVDKLRGFDLLLAYDYTSAVFDAVQRQDLTQLQVLMDMGGADINSVNTDGMTALDVALLLDSHPIVGCLLQHGAQANLLCTDHTTKALSTLDYLLSQCEQAVATLSGAIISNSNKYKQLHSRKLDLWMNKRKLLRRMKFKYNQTELPLPVNNIQLMSTSQTSLKLIFDTLHADPDNSGKFSPVIGYLVEWSLSPLLVPCNTAYISATTASIKYDVTGLQSESPYYITVLAQNMKGFGEPSLSSPLCAVPSSWRSCSSMNSKQKAYNADQIEELYREVKAYRVMDDASSSSSSELSPSPQPQYIKASNSLRKGLKGLFSPPTSIKFAKSVKRDSIYLTCIFYNKERILTTEEDRYLPMLEVDNSYSSSSGAMSAFNWMLKVSCHWQDVAQLKMDMERMSNVTSYSLRHQLLTTVTQLQTLLGIQDLGMLHYRPIKDRDTGAIVFVFVRQILEPKQLTNHPNLKWSSFSKFYKNTPPSDCLVNVVSSEIMSYWESCHRPAPSGLYLGYLQTEFTNGGLFNLLVSHLNPNTLPSVKIRDNPNVTKNEWQALLDLSSTASDDYTKDCSEEKFIFKKQLIRSTRKLMDSLGVVPGLVVEHKIYNYEVLECAPDVSFIIILPPTSEVCNLKRSSTLSCDSTDSDSPSYSPLELLRIPVKSFEVSHLHTYHPNFIRSYTKAMVLLDMELTGAQQAHREAFSDSEIEATKLLVEDLKAHHRTLEEIWSGARWVTDIISIAREKNYAGISIKRLYRSVLNQHKAAVGESRISSHSSDENTDSNTQDCSEHLSNDEECSETPSNEQECNEHPNIVQECSENPSRSQECNEQHSNCLGCSEQPSGDYFIVNQECGEHPSNVKECRESSTDNQQYTKHSSIQQECSEIKNEGCLFFERVENFTHLLDDTTHDKQCTVDVVPN